MASLQAIYDALADAVPHGFLAPGMEFVAPSDGVVYAALSLNTMPLKYRGDTSLYYWHCEFEPRLPKIVVTQPDTSDEELDEVLAEGQVVVRRLADFDYSAQAQAFVDELRHCSAVNALGKAAESDKVAARQERFARMDAALAAAQQSRRSLFDDDEADEEESDETESHRRETTRRPASRRERRRAKFWRAKVAASATKK